METGVERIPPKPSDPPSQSTIPPAPFPPAFEIVYLDDIRPSPETIKSSKVPVIAISFDWKYSPKDGRQYLARTTYEFFAHLCRTANVLMYPIGYEERIQGNSHRWLAGWVIPGGRDIDPKFYFKPNEGSKYEGKEASERWWFTRDMIDKVDARMPILGICYGFQILNCLFGGDMIQDLPGAQKNHYRFNKMEFVGGESWLTKALQGAPYMVGSCSHHQALGKIPECFKVVAVDCRERLPHAFEYIGTPKREIYACIWHPEYTFTDTRHLETDKDNKLIFEWYIERCKLYQATLAKESPVEGSISSETTTGKPTETFKKDGSHVAQESTSNAAQGHSNLANQSEYF